MFYRQCELSRAGIYCILWIPEKFTKLNTYIKLKQEDDSWQDGWFVGKVYDIRIEEKEVRERERDYLHHREATDI